MDVSNIRAALNKEEERYIEVWKELSSIESPTGCKAGVDKAGKYLSSIARELGFAVRSVKENVSGDPIEIVMNADSTEPSVCFSGHIDTVHPVGLFGYPAVKTDSECIYGPGVCDCKGGVVSALYAMSALRSIGFRRRPIKLIIQTDEEVSSAYSEKRTVQFMRDAAKGTSGFINLESMLKGKATVERKGIMRYRIEVEGAAVHSSICYSGKSAVREAAHKIIEFEKIQEKDGITYSVGTVSGGTAANTVPQKCEFVVDIRYRTEEERGIAERRVAEITERSYIGDTRSRAILLSLRPAMELNEKNLRLLSSVNSILSEAGLPTLSANSRQGGSDAADMSYYGIPCIDSLGVVGGYIHSIKEYAFLSSLKESALMLALIALYL